MLLTLLLVFRPKSLIALQLSLLLWKKCSPKLGKLFATLLRRSPFIHWRQWHMHSKRINNSKIDLQTNESYLITAPAAGWQWSGSSKTFQSWHPACRCTWTWWWGPQLPGWSFRASRPRRRSVERRTAKQLKPIIRRTQREVLKQQSRQQ